MATDYPIFFLFFPPCYSDLSLFFVGLPSMMCSVKLLALSTRGGAGGDERMEGKSELRSRTDLLDLGLMGFVVSLLSPGGRPCGRGGLRGEGHPEQPVPPERGVLGPHLPARHDTVRGHQGRRGPGPGQRGAGDGGHPQGEAPPEDGG